MKRTRFLVEIFVILMTINCVFSTSQAYWGNEDSNCVPEHGISHVYGTYVETPAIVLDGKDDDDSWNLPNVYEYIIPMANNVEEAEFFFVSYMNFKCIYDANDIYILMNWNDTTLDIHDMGIFCWDMNCSNYSSYIFVQTGGMETINPGEHVDSWQWVSNFRENETTGLMLDNCYNDEGWKPADFKDTSYGYTYGTWLDGETNHYQLELKRSLITNEPDFDVQFYEETPVRFTASVCDSMENDDHAISWTQDLNLTKNPVKPAPYVKHGSEETTTEDGSDVERGIDGFSPIYLAMVSLLVVSAQIIVTIRKYQR